MLHHLKVVHMVSDEKAHFKVLTLEGDEDEIAKIDESLNNQDKNDHDVEGLFENIGYVSETPEKLTSPIGSSNSFSRSRSLSRSTRSPLIDRSGSPSLSGSTYNSSSSSSSSNVSVPTTQSTQVMYDLLQKKIQSLVEKEKKNR